MSKLASAQRLRNQEAAGQSSAWGKECRELLPSCLQGRCEAHLLQDGPAPTAVLGLPGWKPCSPHRPPVSWAQRCGPPCPLTTPGSWSHDMGAWSRAAVQARLEASMEHGVWVRIPALSPELWLFPAPSRPVAPPDQESLNPLHVTDGVTGHWVGWMGSCFVGHLEAGSGRAKGTCLQVLLWPSLTQALLREPAWTRGWSEGVPGRHPARGRRPSWFIHTGSRKASGVSRRGGRTTRALQQPPCPAGWEPALTLGLGQGPAHSACSTPGAY